MFPEQGYRSTTQNQFLPKAAASLRGVAKKCISFNQDDMTNHSNIQYFILFYKNKYFFAGKLHPLSSFYVMSLKTVRGVYVVLSFNQWVLLSSSQNTQNDSFLFYGTNLRKRLDPLNEVRRWQLSSCCRKQTLVKSWLSFQPSRRSELNFLADFA